MIDTARDCKAFTASDITSLDHLFVEDPEPNDSDAYFSRTRANLCFQSVPVEISAQPRSMYDALKTQHRKGSVSSLKQAIHNSDLAKEPGAL